MRLIRKYDVFVPYEALVKALDSKDSQAIIRERVLKLLHEAFVLGREAEQLERAEETTAKEGGVVKIV